MKVVGGKSKSHFGHHKSHMKYLGNEPGLPNEGNSRQREICKTN
jgi:hypothetical protein